MRIALNFIFLLLSSIAFTQSGTVDANFNSDDLGYQFGDGLDDYATCSAIQQDGMILIGGAFTHIDSTFASGLARIDSLGNVDPTFITGSGFLPSSGVRAITLQTDGKILVGGFFISYNGVPCKSIVRLNVDGTIDNSFTPPTQSASLSISDILVFADSKILLVGSFNFYGNVSANNMVVINDDGSIDPLFNTNLGCNQTVNQITQQSDGKFIATGSFTTFNGSSVNKIVRLLPDLTIDPSFFNGSGPAGVNPFITGSTVNADNSIFVYGNFTTFNGSTSQKLVKLHADGTTDPSFSVNGITINNLKLVLNQSSGGHILLGDFTGSTEHFNIIRINDSGQIDDSYISPYMNLYYPQTAQIYNDGRLFCGAGGSTHVPLLRFHPNGDIDSSFLSPYGANDLVTGSIVQNDGKILLYGENILYKGLPVNGLVRIFNDGSADTTFHSGFSSGQLRAKQMYDGRYFVMGSNGFGVLHPNGSIDTSFHTFSFTGGGIQDIVVQTDNKVVAYGTFTAYNGVPVNNIMRLNVDGSIDPTFQTGSGLSGYPDIIAIQPDQKIILLAHSTFTYNGTSYNGGLRINTDGSIDNSFNVGTGFNFLVNNAIFDNNTILVAGAFTIYNGTTVNRIVRLNQDGSIDNAFVTGNGFNQMVRCANIQNDGKILVSGDFTSYNGTPSNKFARINNDGSYDNDFMIPQNGGTTASMITSISSLQNGKILLTGTFTEYFGIGRNRTVLLNNCLNSYDTLTVTDCESYYWDLTNQTYTVSGNYPTVLYNTCGEDSIVTLNLTINNSSTGTDIQTACGAYEWIDGITYTTATNTPTWTLQNSVGCDSIVTLNLTITPSEPTLIENTFSLPSDPNNCVGEFAVDLSGNGDFELDIDNGSQTATTSGYSLFTALCPGIHDLQIINFCGDTTTTQFVIPVDSNYVFNNPFIDSLAQDSLGTTFENCDIYYAGIDTAYIDSIWATGNTVNVIWNIVDSNGSNLDTTTYELNNGNGVYWLQLSVFCPTKALGDYFTVTEAIYFEDGDISTAGIWDLEDSDALIYPNPTNNLVTISFEMAEAELTIYDAQGKVIQNRSSIHSGEQVSLANVQTGVYFFELSTSEGEVVKRVVKN